MQKWERKQAVYLRNRREASLAEVHCVRGRLEGDQARDAYRSRYIEAGRQPV